MSVRPATLVAPARALLWAAGFALALVICSLWGASTGVHDDFTQNVWLPARLVLDGANPYSPTRSQVDAALGAYAADFTGPAAFNSGAAYHFIYPVWLAVAMSPFAALPLVVATAIWRALNLVLLVWSIGAVLRSAGPAFRSLRAAAVGATALTMLMGVLPTYRESFLTLYVGQFSIIELALLVAIWGWLINSDRLDARRQLWGDALAGLALAVLATKPQAIGLPIILLGIWALTRRRYLIPGAALASLALLLVVPNLFYSRSLSDWLAVVFGSQASSQAQVSASVWGVSYQWLGGTPVPWVAVALVLTLAGVAALIPRWWSDLRDRTSPVPLALPLTICVNSVISPYMLGYEQVLLLMPALIFLAAAGLPGEQGTPAEARNSRLWRLAIYAWMAVLPFLVLGVQAGLGGMEYPAIAQSISMLALCWVTKLEWKKL